MTDEHPMVPGSLVFERYRLEQWIGAGGMGVVWRATDLLLDQPVALKRVALANVGGEPAEVTRARTLREAKSAARLRQHRNVVAIYDVRIDEGAVWLVLEYVPSRSLSALLRDRGPLPLAEVARIGACVADALAAGHAQGVLHRDVTPGNVLVADDGTAKLTDFGVSHLVGHPEITRKGMITGTIAYLAPEVAGGSESTPASDVFSLGATLYATIEGRPPFGSDDNALRLLNVVRTGIIQPPASAGPLADVLARLLQLDPSTRPDAATAHALLDRVATRATAVTEQHLPAPESGTDVLPFGGPVHRPGRPHPRRRLLPALAGLAVLGLAIAIGLRTLTGDPAPPPAEAGTPPPATLATVGDPATADPCSLMDPAPLRRYGSAERSSDFGHFEECAVTITLPTGGYVDVLARFDQRLPTDQDLSGPVERRGPVVVASNPAGETECGRTLLLADRHRLQVEARGYGAGYTSSSVDLCAVADVAVTTAVDRLGDAPIARRPTPAEGNSLAAVDACTLLDPADLTRVLGTVATGANRGVAGWSCAWGGDGSGGSSRVVLDYYRSRPPADSASGERLELGGRSVEILPGGYVDEPGMCLAQLEHRPFTGPTGISRVELVLLTVRGDAPADQLCAQVTDLAEAASTRMPPL